MYDTKKIYNTMTKIVTSSIGLCQAWSCRRHCNRPTYAFVSGVPQSDAAASR